MLKIVQNTPPWVWSVLALLLVLGFWQSRTRCLPRAALLPLPIVMLVFAIYGLVGGFGWKATALGGWLAGFSVLLVVLRFLPTMPGVYRREDGCVQIPGSWWPGVWMLAIFMIRYAMGIARARGWPGMEQPEWAMAIGLLLGMLSGFFVLRSLRILRAASRYMR